MFGNVSPHPLPSSDVFLWDVVVSDDAVGMHVSTEARKSTRTCDCDDWQRLPEFWLWCE